MIILLTMNKSSINNFFSFKFLLKTFVTLGTMISNSLCENVTSPSFMAIGDWGGSSIDLNHSIWQKSVSNTFSKKAEQIKPRFIIGTGDNFYYYGVKESNDTLFDTDFENIYSSKELMVPWYQTLGNHDYAYNPQAQIEYRSLNNDRWKMKDRFYFERIKLNNNSYATFIFLDTSPCILDYRRDDPKNWDPCSTKYPGPKDCKFHQNILNQSCEIQFKWLKKLIYKINKNDWIIGVGHHPANQINVNDLTYLLKKVKMDLYLNGHAHELRHYLIENEGCYITTGAGSMVSTQKNVNNFNSNNYPITKWNNTIAGFTTHTFSKDLNYLKNDFIDYKGNTLYSILIKKNIR